MMQPWLGYPYFTSLPRTSCILFRDRKVYLRPFGNSTFRKSPLMPSHLTSLSWSIWILWMPTHLQINPLLEFPTVWIACGRKRLLDSTPGLLCPRQDIYPEVCYHLRVFWETITPSFRHLSMTFHARPFCFLQWMCPSLDTSQQLCCLYERVLLFPWSPSQTSGRLSRLYLVSWDWYCLYAFVSWPFVFEG